MKQAKLNELIEQYRLQDAPEDQQILIMLLKDVQQLCGGVLPTYALNTIADAYQLKLPLLHALIRRISALHSEDAPHSLELCGTCREGRQLAAFIEETYRIKSGECSKTGGFSYRITGCMKNCKCGPSARWDGHLISRANCELIENLIRTGRLPGESN